ncbi:MAG TPA: heme-binding protein [Burkholderiales bacterium]|nr:heme-binding protein [Burkholderiales bacterium]
MLKLTQALSIVDGAIAEARNRNFLKLGVVVLDAGGHVVAFKREDGASFLRFELAYGKAWGALAMGFGTRELAERAGKQPAFINALAAVTQGRMVPSPGGVLIASAGEVIGALGISGDTGDNDEVCALAGIQASGLSAIPGARAR